MCLDGQCLWMRKEHKLVKIPTNYIFDKNDRIFVVRPVTVICTYLFTQWQTLEGAAIAGDLAAISLFQHERIWTLNCLLLFKGSNVSGGQEEWDSERARTSAHLQKHRHWMEGGFNSWKESSDPAGSLTPTHRLKSHFHWVRWCLG